MSLAHLVGTGWSRGAEVIQRSHRVGVAGCLAVLLGALAHAGPASSAHQARVDAALRSHGIDAVDLSSDLVVSWNGVGYELAFAEDQFLTFKGQRALAMMHLAMHDSLNAIVPIYDAYALRGSRCIAHPIAAAARAAHDVLWSQYPGQQVRLGQELARWLARVLPGPFRACGEATGRAAAAAIVDRRNGDGWDFPGTYEFHGGPGRYQTTPPWNGFVVQPGFRFAKPFVLEYPHQFRPSGPPPPRTRAYARALREVQENGAADSARRSDDQTAYAIWWMEFAEGSVNRLARQLSTDRKINLWAAARLFAQIAVALYDTYVATWDAKYSYDHWRPYTAIRAADTDGNQDTLADARWEPLRPTPPFPEYSSAHAAACAASFGLLAEAFGRDVPFTMTTTTAPPDMPTRAFRSFAAAAVECADSRVKLGWHFRYATDAGLALGQRIARYIMKHALQPSADRDDKDR